MSSSGKECVSRDNSPSATQGGWCCPQAPAVNCVGKGKAWVGQMCRPKGCATDFGVRARLSSGGSPPHAPSRLPESLRPGVTDIRSCFKVNLKNPTGLQGGGLRGAWWQRSLCIGGRRRCPRRWGGRVRAHSDHRLPVIRTHAPSIQTQIWTQL